MKRLLDWPASRPLNVSGWLVLATDVRRHQTYGRGTLIREIQFNTHLRKFWLPNGFGRIVGKYSPKVWDCTASHAKNPGEIAIASTSSTGSANIYNCGGKGRYSGNRNRLHVIMHRRRTNEAADWRKQLSPTSLSPRELTW